MDAAAWDVDHVERSMRYGEKITKIVSMVLVENLISMYPTWTLKDR